MADVWRRYLAQQIELGGTEIVLGAPPRATVSVATERVAATPVPDVVPQAVVNVVVDVVVNDVPTQESEMPRKPFATADIIPDEPKAKAADSRGKSDTPKWLKGAPPIPGPGLSITAATPVRQDLQALPTLDAIADHIRASSCCGLCAMRTNAVPGEGNPRAKFVLIGEGPGATEDATGRPFVGQAGQLLDGILDAIELPRDTVYITNIVKCRPPQNRKPLPDEVAACLPYLHRQLELLRPKVILLLGGTAAESLLGVKGSLGELRGKVHTYNGIPVVVTYHPAALLRNPNWKKPTWDDVRIARQLLDR